MLNGDRLFRKKKSGEWIATVICLAAALLLSVVPTILALTGGGNLREAAVRLTLPLGEKLDAAGESFRETLSGAGGKDETIRSLRERIDALEAELAATRGDLAQAEALQTENEALRALLGLEKQASGALWIDASEILSLRDVAGGNYTLNRGASDGVRAGAAVMSSAGLFGFVGRVREDFCVVCPVGKSETAVGVVNGRTGAVGVLLCETAQVGGGVGQTGDATARAVIRYIRNADGTEAAGGFAVGDEIRTAGGNPLCPAGLLIGRVSEVGQDAADGTRYAGVALDSGVGRAAGIYLIVTGSSESADAADAQNSPKLEVPPEPAAFPKPADFPASVDFSNSPDLLDSADFPTPANPAGPRDFPNLAGFPSSAFLPNTAGAGEVTL